ncbi:F-box protein [Actinidia chinensis var. chinensis]|uniref:F-box protein n=1 Tax=Actinidia chinensis var. chinensis TaxID=1590841 RepID=A0A2R6QCV6_ACTCC|nr:F-box protein [Actinidia chinensis var. chinensis]
MSDNLPSDVLIEILTRLPVKSLVLFSCVCKHWYTLITNPVFISTHLNRSHNQLLFVRHYNMFQEMERYALHFPSESYGEYAELECPVKSVNEYFRILGSCNGLICLSDDYSTHTDTIVIWNPSVRRSVTLPKPGFPHATQGTCLLGFGFDALSNDYKVVRIVYEHNVPDDSYYRLPPNVEIYALSTGNWRSISGASPNYVMYRFFPLPALMNGAVHWVANGQGNSSSVHNLVAAFDMCDEVFREIMMPDDLVETEVLKLSISVLGTSLALIQYEKIWQSEYCWVWMMKEYGAAESWTRLFTIDMRFGIRKVVGFQNNQVLLSARIKGLILYDPKSQQVEYLGIHGTNRSFYVDTYVESLVLLKGENSDLLLANSSDAVTGERETQVLREEGRTEE